MNSHYYTEIAFPAAVQEALAELSRMKRALDNYKLKPDANANWIEEREQGLAKLWNLIETSRETVSVLYQEGRMAHHRGFEKGKAQAEKEHLHREQFGTLNFDSKKDKEQIRALSILNAQEKYNL